MENIDSVTAAFKEACIQDHEDSGEEFDWSRYKAHNIYEGSDSEDERLINEALKKRHKGPLPPGLVEILPPRNSTCILSIPASVVANTKPATEEMPVKEVREYDLQLGQLATQGEEFCSWNLVKNYPFNYIGTGNRDRVNKGFFDEGKVSDRVWDFFYIHPSAKKGQVPIFLVTTKQFKQFLQDINWRLETSLRIPGGPSQHNFLITFPNDGNPQPRYLGHSKNHEMAEDLKKNAPPSYYKLDGEPKPPNPSDRSIEAFRAKIRLMEQDAKAKKTANKLKQKADRIARQKDWNHSIKRMQRYLGLRETREDQDANIRALVHPDVLRQAWGGEHDNVVAAKSKVRHVELDPNMPAPFRRDASVVFVCVDLEAYERNTSLITEIGIATLDTADLEGVAPGVNGVNWRSLVRARHFRIHEHRNLNNTEFVSGCADMFEFGQSEFVKLKDAPNTIASCFKHPFSKLGETCTDEEPKRNIVLVGHDVKSDINFLRTLGYDVFNLSTLQEVADTATMWQYVTRDTSIRKLATILSELGITGWNLHNAGNDAVYTLQAMLGISMKHLYERSKQPDAKEAERSAKIAETVKEATDTALDNQLGWSSEGGNSDGGVPLRPVPPPPKYISDGRARDGSYGSGRGGSYQGKGIQSRGSYGSSSQASGRYDSGGW